MLWSIKGQAKWKLGGEGKHYVHKSLQEKGDNHSHVGHINSWIDVL